MTAPCILAIAPWPERSVVADASLLPARPPRCELGPHDAGSEVDRLAELGCVWGFLKYHHPRVTGGEVDWDAALLRILPAVRGASDAAAYRAALMELCAAAGPYDVGPARAAPPEQRLNLDLRWLRAPLLGGEVRARLAGLLHVVPPARQRYVAFAPNGNAVFPGEDPRAEPAYPEAAVRLLALFRYWNAIEYFHPYKYATDQDWHEVLHAFVPRVMAAGDAGAYHAALAELAAQTGDGHAVVFSQVIDERLGSRLPDVRIARLDGHLVVTGTISGDPLFGGLARGDQLTAIAGGSARRRWDDLAPTAFGSNEGDREQGIGAQLLRTRSATLGLTVLRGGEEIAVEVPTVEQTALHVGASVRRADPREAAWRDVAAGVLYVDLARLRRPAIAPLVRALADKRAVIFELRCYPEFVIYDLVPHLIEERTAFARITVPEPRAPGAFRHAQPLHVGAVRRGPRAFSGRTVVLIDASTKSRGEFFAMALKAVPGATLMGSRTAGADGDFTSIALPGGAVAGLSGLGVYWPDGTETQRVGIVPDIEVRPTIAGVQAGRDEVLERALAELATGSGDGD